MTKVTENTHKSKDSFLKEIESLNTTEAKALLPFFRKYSPLEAFKVFNNNLPFIPPIGKGGWFKIFFIQRNFLELYSLERKQKLHSNHVDLSSAISNLLSGAEDLRMQKGLKYYLFKLAEDKDGLIDFSKRELNLILSLMNVCNYVYQVEHSKDKGEDFLLRLI